MLAFDNVVRSFDGGRVAAVRGVSLNIGSGECIALTGRSGSGKTCLLNMAGGIDLPTAGRVLWRGQPVASRRAWAALRRDEIGIVFQEFNLLPTLTALQNVEIALMGSALTGRAQRAKAEAALARMGLEGRARHVPAALSGGERQRVAIARALVREPSLLLADEPTGSLDSVNAANIAGLLLGLPRERGMTLLMVTHDPALAARCPRRIVMHDGAIMSDDRPGGEFG
ncbi:ABC transporter ATP-binding protein [Roseomonas sp. CAU 1739]